MIITFSNQKGGVGKTTLCYNIASLFAKDGKKVLVIDGDPQGNLTQSFGSEPQCETLLFYHEELTRFEPEKVRKNLFLAGTTRDLSIVEGKDFVVVYFLNDQLTKRKKEYDYIIIDAPPSLGKLSISILNATQYVIIPVLASPYSVIGVLETLKLMKKVRKRMNPNLHLLGIVFNKLKPRINFYHEIVNAVDEIEHHMLFETVIHDSIRIAEAPNAQKTITEHARNSKAATQMEAFKKEIKIC